jgi:TPR repeat protein
MRTSSSGTIRLCSRLIAGCFVVGALAWPHEATSSDLLNTFEKTETGDIESGVKAFDDGRYADALKWLSGAAKDGNADAEVTLGLMYWYGSGVPKDYEHAMNLFQLSAAQGNGRAMNVIGYAYQNGIGALPDLAKAVSWYEKSAEKGERRGQNNLAILYSEGVGVSKNLEKADALWRQAAEQGDSGAMIHLGDACWYGKGVPADKDAALEWWRKATLGGRVTLVDIGEQYVLGKNVQKDPDVAAQLFGQAVLSGDTAAEAALGWMSYTGEGVPKDTAKAVKMVDAAADAGVVDAMLYEAVIDLDAGNASGAADWARRAADKGNARAMAYYGIALLNGSGAGLDVNEAILSFGRATSQDDAMGEYYLSRAYQVGQGVLSRDYTHANDLLSRSSAQGFAKAQVALGENFLNGVGIRKDDESAAKLFRDAAQQDEPQGMYDFGAALADGTGVAKDTAQAASWFERAAQYGQPRAMQRLAGLLYAANASAGDRAKAYYWAQLAVRYYRPGDADDATNIAEIRSGLLPTLEKIVPLQTRQKLDADVIAFRPKVWFVPAPAFAATLRERPSLAEDKAPL